MTKKGHQEFWVKNKHFGLKGHSESWLEKSENTGAKRFLVPQNPSRSLRPWSSINFIKETHTLNPHEHIK